MGRILRIAIAAALAVAVIVVGAVGTLEAMSWWDKYRFERAAPLAARLPSDLSNATGEFQRRIRERFPIGTPQQELVDVLASQGFQLTSGNAASMHLTIPGGLTTGLCARDWYVFWQANRDGHLSQIDAHYYFTCP